MTRFLAKTITEADRSGDDFPSLAEHRTNPLHDTQKNSELGSSTVVLSAEKSALNAEEKTSGSQAAIETIVSPVLPESEASRTHSRLDPISGRWTIFAVSRVDRPSGFLNIPLGENASFACPFCSGNERETPPAVLEISSHECESLAIESATLCAREQRPHTVQSGSDWAIRVIPNKYPAVEAAVQMCGDSAVIHETQASDRGGSLFHRRPISGGHEVFVESPDHRQSLETLDLSHATMVFHAYQLRMRHWREVSSIRYVSLFKNLGPAAGASLHHSHSQLIATSEMPIAAKAIAARMKHHWAKTGCCLQCDTIRAEIKAKQRVVATTRSMVAYCPFGSHLPRLLRITTRRHLECFEDLTMEELGELVRLVRRSIHWLQAIYPDVAYNYLVQTRPPGISTGEMAHWALEIFPRVTQVAGFEWSSDCMINPILPEDAAATFRELAMNENPLR